MFTHPSLEHKAERNAIDKVVAAKEATPSKALKGAVETITQERAEVQVDWNPRTGAPALLHGMLTPRMGGSPSEIAAAALADIGEAVGVEPTLSNAVEVDRFEWNGFEHVRYQQTYEGEPVYGAELVVAINPDNQVQAVSSDFDPAVSVTAEESVVSEKDAIQTALDDLADGGTVQLDGRITDSVVIYPTEEGYARCYHFLIPAAEPLGDWRYFVDVSTGDIVDSYNSMCYYHGGRANVYTQNPEDTALITGILRNLKSPYSKLIGTYGTVLNDDAAEAVAGPGLSFLYPVGDTHFDEANMYHAVERVYRHFRDIGFRGLIINNPYGKSTTPKGQIRAHVHVGTNFDNAYYSPATGEIYFGDGSYPGNPGGLRDLSKESDVVFHEFTHAVLDEYRPGIGGIDGKALHEGYADYHACSFTNPPEPQLGEWVVPGPGLIRNLNNTDTYPGLGNPPTEPHKRGLVWGGACWSLRKKLGGELADYLIFGSMLFITTTAPTFKYAKDKILAIDAAYFAGAYKATIKDIYEVQRKIPV
jgi:Zn-dependent metalloprotease